MFSTARNDWRRPLIKPSVPRLPIKSYTRENDLTFSFGELVDYDDVVNLLLQSGCIDRKNYLDEIKMLKLTKSVHNGQVFVTCAKPNVCDEWVRKLNAMDGSGIRKCHSYSDKEVTVKFSFIHPSINIQKEIVEGFLEKHHGPVKEWSALKENKWGIPNGAYVFIMREEDLEKRPIPESVFLGHIQVYVSYRTQVMTCHRCKEAGHIAVNCPKEEMFPMLQQTQNRGGLKVFLAGVAPRGSSYRTQFNRRNDNNGDVLSQLGRKNDASKENPPVEEIQDGEGDASKENPVEEDKDGEGEKVNEEVEEGLTKKGEGKIDQQNKDFFDEGKVSASGGGTKRTRDKMEGNDVPRAKVPAVGSEVVVVSQPQQEEEEVMMNGNNNEDDDNANEEDITDVGDDGVSDGDDVSVSTEEDDNTKYMEEDDMVGNQNNGDGGFLNDTGGIYNMVTHDNSNLPPG